MNTSRTDVKLARAHSVSITDEALTVHVEDGRTITTPLAWFPRLAHGSFSERQNWRLIAHGEGIHWPELDEDISVESLLAGRTSGESEESFRHWLERRQPRA